MAHSFYVYYRVQPAHAGACAPRVAELLSAVRKATGVGGRLMVKRGEPHLWMEVYENVADEARFERELAAATDRLALQDFLQAGSTRRVECFHDAGRA